MVEFAKLSAAEQDAVDIIVDRAMEAGVPGPPMRIMMDLQATHATTPLDLPDLATFPLDELVHDVQGISLHLNRETGTLEGFFTPRCAKGDS